MSSMRGRGGMRGGRGGAAAAASAPRKRKAAAAADGSSGQGQNSNALAFAAPPAAATAALQRWRRAQPVEAAAGVIEIKEEEEDAEAAALSLEQSIADEQWQVAALRRRPAPQPDTLTANGDPSFSTSRCARLDLFYQMVRGAEAAKIERLLGGAWAESAEHAVQLLLHGRDARGGKGERLVSLFAMVWLRTHKPATYLHNLTTFLALGYFKDLLQLAKMVAEGKLPPMGAAPREDKVRKEARQQQQQLERRAGGRRGKGKASKVQPAAGEEGESDAEQQSVVVVSASSSSSSSASSAPVDGVEHEVLELEVMAEYLKADWERLQAHQAKMAARREKQAAAAVAAAAATAAAAPSEQKQDGDAAAAAVPMVDVEECKAEVEPAAVAEDDEEEDSEWGAAQDEFEAAVAADAAAVAAGTQQQQQTATAAASSSAPARKPRQPRPARDPHLQLSLAAKWAPSEGSSFDKKHRMARRLARLMFPNDPQCFRLYRSALSACREHLNITERFLCAKQFDRIDFEKIPSKCHQLLKKALGKHCAERYAEYLGKLKRGEARINTAGIMPHELASDYVSGKLSQVDETVEGAWRTLLANLRLQCASSGGLANAVAVVDVSGSMTCFNGLPLNVAVSLGLLVANLATGPFAARVITFSEQPRWHALPDLQSASLLQQVQSVKGAHWGMSTDLDAVFEMILTTAVSAGCRSADLPRTIFIFSDMQFNSAIRDENQRGGCHSRIRARYSSAGFEVPQVVYWNLNGHSHADCPVDVTTPGVAVIGGYSADLLKAFLEGRNIDPMGIMMHSIAGYRAVIEESER